MNLYQFDAEILVEYLASAQRQDHHSISIFVTAWQVKQDVKATNTVNAIASS